MSVQTVDRVDAPRSPDRVDAPRSPDHVPTIPLSVVQLFQISVFWFALNTIWGSFELFQQARVEQLTSTWPTVYILDRPITSWVPIALGVMEVLAMVVAALTMPIAGSISDYTSSRWGRRKPFILVGALMTFGAMAGIALSPTYIALVGCFILLQFTSNTARGPFAGLVPDLVPERQIGTASGLMGLMLTLGLVGGYLITVTGLPTKDFTVQLIVIGGFIAVTGLGTFLWVPNGPAGKDRQGRPWSNVARETFGTDMLRQRSYVFLLGSRFAILMAAGFFMNYNYVYLTTVLGIVGDETVRVGPFTPTDQQYWILVAIAVATVATAIGTIPAARISDRVGRKPVIYASCAIGAIGMAVIGLARDPQVLVIGTGIVGLAAGIFLSVDWALMTEIIPKESAGRYMGMSNIVEATNGPLGTALGAIVWAAIGWLSGADAVGGRAAMLTGIVLFVIGALLLTQVVEPVRRPHHQAALAHA
jgi:MFS family permease